MSTDFERNLDKYAEVIVKVGLNLQPGQRLLIGMPFYNFLGTPIELAPIVRRIAHHAYQVGVRHVEILWNDEQIELIRYKSAPRDSFQEFPSWRTDAAYDIAQAGDAILILSGGKTDLLSNQDPVLINTFFEKTLEKMRPTIDLRVKGAINLVIAFTPVEGWADKVFGHLPAESRIIQAWETTFTICRIMEPDPVASWENHIRELNKRCEYLNNKKYSSLKLISPYTDLSIGLPDGHVWRGGNMTTTTGINYTANLPTEEIFTIPHKDKTEGVVKVTKPIPGGTGSVEDIILTFSKGKVIKSSASKGNEDLDNILNTDEGMLRLGEIALVPHSSPISQSGLFYYSVIIDENASNHIALGRAYQFCLEGGDEMSDDEFESKGGNISLDHQDFMIGSAEMNVFGLTDNGSSEPIMKSGEWAFPI
jgi:aminopeptidase